jgi:urease accessory protein UreF
MKASILGAVLARQCRDNAWQHLQSNLTSQTDACILCLSPPLAAGVNITAQLSGVIGLAYLQCTSRKLDEASQRLP